MDHTITLPSMPKFRIGGKQPDQGNTHGDLRKGVSSQGTKGLKSADAKPHVSKNLFSRGVSHVAGFSAGLLTGIGTTIVAPIATPFLLFKGSHVSEFEFILGVIIGIIGAPIVGTVVGYDKGIEARNYAYKKLSGRTCEKVS